MIGKSAENISLSPLRAINTLRKLIKEAKNSNEAKKIKSHKFIKGKGKRLILLLQYWKNDLCIVFALTIVAIVIGVALSRS